MARLWTSWREAGGRMGGHFGWRYADIAGVRSPPLQGASQGEVALRGEPGDGARGGFLGGARPPRPGGKAVRRPRDFIPTGWLPMTRWPTGDMPRWSDGAIAGVRSPPLRGGLA